MSEPSTPFQYPDDPAEKADSPRDLAKGVLAVALSLVLDKSRTANAARLRFEVMRWQALGCNEPLASIAARLRVDVRRVQQIVAELEALITSEISRPLPTQSAVSSPLNFVLPKGE